MICDGCGQEIPEGLHIMRCAVTLDTRMPPEIASIRVREVEPTVLNPTLCTPMCFVMWAKDDPIMRDVFFR